MKIITGATSSDGRHISVELEESDIERDLSELSLAKKHKVMMQHGDLLIVSYFRDAGVFTKDYAEQRIREITSR